MRTESNAHVAIPPQELFETKNAIDQSLLNPGQIFNLYERVEYPPEGGIYIYFKGIPYPRKGFPTPEAVYNNDLIKRFTLTMVSMVADKAMILPMAMIALMPWKTKLRLMHRAADKYIRMMDWTIRGHYLIEKRYSNPCRSLRKVIKDFILLLGLDMYIAEEIAKGVATIFEYDDAYRLRLEDVASETRQWKLANNPVSEICRLRKIFMARENIGGVKDSVGGLFKIFSIALFHPKVRRAWRIAIMNMNSIDFRWLQLDNADRYHVLRRSDYNFTGRTLEQRTEIYLDVHRRSKCCGEEVRKVYLPGFDGVKVDHYECKKCGKTTEEGYVFPPEVEVAPQ